MAKYRVGYETRSQGLQKYILEADTYEIRDGILRFGVKNPTEPGQPQSLQTLIIMNWDKVVYVEPVLEPASEGPQEPRKPNLFS